MSMIQTAVPLKRIPQNLPVILLTGRFLLGENEGVRNFLRQKILGIDAVTGALIWEERGHTL